MGSQNRVFTDEEFDIMINQLIIQKPSSFDMLCDIIYRTLHDWVIAKCRKYKVFRGWIDEDDVFSDVQCKLVNITVTDFLLKDGVNGEINRDPAGFKSWMFTVASNLIKDSVYKEVRSIGRCRFLYNGEEFIGDDGFMSDDVLLVSQERIEMIKSATSIVLDSSSKPYIIFTWLSMCLLMLYFDITKIEANHKICNMFFEKSLYDMYYALRIASKKILRFDFTENQIAVIEKKLSKNLDDGKVYGSIRYKEFFMKKEPMNCISDWENRMNTLVKRVIKEWDI